MGFNSAFKGLTMQVRSYGKMQDIGKDNEATVKMLQKRSEFQQE
jgi:hypothetical protein